MKKTKWIIDPTLSKEKLIQVANLALKESEELKEQNIQLKANIDKLEKLLKVAINNLDTSNARYVVKARKFYIHAICAIEEEFKKTINELMKNNR